MLTTLELRSTTSVTTIAAACALGDRVAVFVTGVPGSGKTLAGLNAIHQISEDPDDPAEPLGAYLSGNGPLVDVLGTR